MEIVKGHQEVIEVTLTLLKRGRVTERTLIVGDGPLRSAHDTEVVISVGVDAAEECVLRAETLAGH